MINKDWFNTFLDNISDIKNVKNKKIYYNELKKHLPKYLYKYSSFDNDYALDNLENDIIYFSTPNKFNDPFDCVFAYDIQTDKKKFLENIQIESLEELDKLLVKNKDNAIKLIKMHYFITCFSEEPNNILMWSHYANKHTGFCVEYEISKLSIDYLFGLFPVFYKDTRLELSKLVKQKNRVALFRKGLLYKSDIWNYEKEWRLVLPKIYIENNYIKQNIISNVYCGINISSVNKQKLINIIDIKNQRRNKSHKIGIKYYKLDDLKYELNLIK